MESGTKLGPYEIVEQLGAGGMGEVWLAQDARLGRQVAIKVLPAQFASDPERLARFEQEARASAALNHPHIAAVYDVGAEPGEGDETTHFMVQEYLQGKSLREAMEAGPVPVDKALALATEIAEALRAAHRAGIVHRDLKPENVFITEDGHAKVLDFGLAKLTEVATGGLSSQSMSPTVLGTQAGSVMGTAGYMAPEQVNGEEVDARADLFAFGCLLYELVTGTRAFAGKSIPHTLHKILDEEPEGFEANADRLPLRLRWLLERCLAKSADARAQHAGDVVVELQQIARDVESGSAITGAGGPSTAVAAAGGEDGHAMAARRSGIPLGAAAATVVVFMALAAGLTWMARPAVDVPVSVGPVRFSVALPPGAPDFANRNQQVLAISPDGRKIALVADDQLWLRTLDDPEPVAVRGSTDPRSPAFSPDSQQLAFWRAGQIQRVDLVGGTPIQVGPMAGRPFGVHWGHDGFIYAGMPDGAGIVRFPATGGEPELVVEAEGNSALYGPRLLAGGEWLMYTQAEGRNWSGGHIMARSLATAEERTLLEGGHDAIYAPTGHLLYVTGGVLLARRFDPHVLTVQGGAVPLVDGVRTSGGGVTGAAYYGLSATGAFVYVGGDSSGVESARFGWVSHDGNVDMLPATAENFDSDFAVSPDGRRVAAAILGQELPYVVLLEVDRPGAQRLTPAGDSSDPVWSHDGRHVYFTSRQSDDAGDLWRRPADLSSSAEPVLETPGRQVPGSVSTDGRWLYYQHVLDGAPEIWRLPLDEGGEPELVVEGATAVVEPRVSPDGKRLAFASFESGNREIFVLDLESRRRWLVSTAGGGAYDWSRAHDGLHYVWGNGLYIVEYEGEPEFEPSAARLVRPHVSNRLGFSDLTLHPDGTRVLERFRADSGTTSEGTNVAPRVEVVLNWFDELLERAPVDR